MRARLSFVMLAMMAIFVVGIVPSYAVTLSMESLGSVMVGGGVFDVKIYVDDATGIAGAAMTLSYDANMVEPVTTSGASITVPGELDRISVVDSDMFGYTIDKREPPGTPANDYPRIGNIPSGQTGMMKILLSGAYVDPTSGKGAWTGKKAMFKLKFKTKSTTGPAKFSLAATAIYNPSAGYGTDTNTTPVAVDTLVAVADNWNATPPPAIQDQFIKITPTFPGDSTVTVSNGSVQTIAIGEGWGWMSFNVVPISSTISGILGANEANIEQIKTQTKSATKVGTSWIGSLDIFSNIPAGTMFKIKVKAGQTANLSVTGAPLGNGTGGFPLVTGWNWIAYTGTACGDTQTVLASILPTFVQLKNQTQNLTKLGTSYIGNLTQMCPNVGYALKVSAPGTLVFP